MSALPLKIVFSEPSIDILRPFQSFPSNKIVSLTRYVPSESFNDISPLPCSFSAKFIAAFSVAKGFFDEPSAVLIVSEGANVYSSSSENVRAKNKAYKNQRQKSHAFSID